MVPLTFILPGVSKTTWLASAYASKLSSLNTCLAKVSGNGDRLRKILLKMKLTLRFEGVIPRLVCLIILVESPMIMS